MTHAEGGKRMALIYEKKEGIAYLTLNRPEARNALDPETVLELTTAWKD
jgi:enoyl-CoA hydratase/carnithine racemase